MKIYIGILFLNKSDKKEKLDGKLRFIYKLGYSKKDNNSVVEISMGSLFKASEFKKGNYYFAFNAEDGMFSCIKDDSKKILCEEAYAILLSDSYIKDNSIVDKNLISSIDDIRYIQKANKNPDGYFKSFKVHEDFSFIRKEMKDENVINQIDDSLEVGKKAKIAKSSNFKKKQLNYKNMDYDSFRISINSFEILNAFLRENSEYFLSKKELIDEYYFDQIIPQFIENKDQKVTFEKDKKTYNSTVKVYADGFFYCDYKKWRLLWGFYGLYRRCFNSSLQRKI